MATKWKGLLLGCAGLTGLGVAGCCGGGVVTWMLAPGMLLRLVTEAQPLAIVPLPRDPAAVSATQRRTMDELAATRTTRLSADEVSRLVQTQDETVVSRITSDDRGNAAFDMSIGVDGGRFLNIHLVGAFVMEKGWFTHMAVDEARIAGFELSTMFAGQELATNANQSLANERAKDPSIAAILDGLDRFATEPGGFALTVNEQGYQALTAAQ